MWHSVLAPKVKNDFFQKFVKIYFAWRSAGLNVLELAEVMHFKGIKNERLLNFVLFSAVYADR